MGFPGGSGGKEPAGSAGFNPWIGKILGEGNGNLLQCSLPGKSHEPRLSSMGSKRVRDD